MAVVVTFGEIMLRLKPPGVLRLGQSEALEATFGGGEANVAVSLAQFGHATRFVSALPANPIGDWCAQTLRAQNVDVTHCLRRGERLGIYFLEAGASQRASTVTYDRAGSAVSRLEAGQLDWKSIFAGASWFHLTGITPALSAGCAAASHEALTAAKQAGLTTSLDLNFRKKLWSKSAAQKTMTGLMDRVDVAVANEEDCALVFGISAGDVTTGRLERDGYLEVAAKMLAAFPALKQIAITLRESHSAGRNGWSGLLADRAGHAFGPRFDLEVVDRVGGGDSFAAGLIHALLTGKSREAAIAWAVAASALKHSIVGDFNRVSVAEVDQLAGGDGSGRVQR
ncbi:MAG: PfkB family carbohydrate kinase [Planctomycetota bacterium]